MRKGRFQIYTGNGKGKTTASLGLSVRAACSGMKVYFGQFMKGQDYSELKVPERFPEITMNQFGTPKLLCQGEKPAEEDLRKAENGAKKIREALLSGEYDLVVADEICVTVHLGLLPEAAALELAAKRPPEMELVFTGRYASEAMIDAADLVTEMKEIKHYYNTEKLMARKGIEN
ncbi:cob(I)yrinic acid a,c-diamide adenosyltransferase [Candidatus Fermentibacteria bacterium]|nr:MAG: cob(I)yrinic acid a,c-diamide adenosyltransferase [Candidatus Fermentibacteria bacterium]